jgi:hypothetical protein
MTILLIFFPIFVTKEERSVKMINKLILKPKYRNILKTLVLVILIAFSATLYSCQTVYTENYTPEKFKTDENVKILEVTSKNDSTINLSDYNVIYKENHKDSSNILLIEKADTIFVKEQGPNSYKLKRILYELNLKDVKNVKVEKTTLNVGKTALLVGCAALVMIAIAGIIYIISFSSAMNSLHYTFH